MKWWSREYLIKISFRGCARALAVCAVACASIVVIVFLAHVYILTWVARGLVSEDPLQPAGAIVVLAGANPEREVEAARLYNLGWAPLVVVPRGPEPPGNETLFKMNVTVERPYELRIRILQALGVPDEAIVRMPSVVDSTYEEAQAVGEWAAEHRIASLLVVTSRFHTRRVRFTYDRVVVPRGITVKIHGVEIDGTIRPDNWWTSRPGIRTVLFELQKLTLYRLLY